MVDFEKFAAESRIKIIKNLENFFIEKERESLPKYFFELEIFSSLSRMVSKGKLTRGTLFLFGCEIYKIGKLNEIIDIACAIELLHTGLLIHDDIIDNDKLRRGLPTIHTYFKEKGEKIGAVNSSHYGTSMGILVGDVAFHFAFELLSNYSGENLGKLLSYYAQEVNRVGLAEGADSHFGQTIEEPSMDEIRAIYRYKTARYTFSMPFTMAGIVANKDKPTIEVLDKIGELAGFIFQIKDDELGLMGTEEKIGKSVGSDIRENKKTIIRKLLYEKVDASELKILNSLFGKKDIFIDDVEKIKKLLKKYNIQGEIDKEIKITMDEINKLFLDLELGEEYKEALQQVLLSNLKRKS